MAADENADTVWVDPNPPMPDSTTINSDQDAADEGLRIGSICLSSRLIVGTGKYATYAQMAQCLTASGKVKLGKNLRWKNLTHRMKSN